MTKLRLKVSEETSIGHGERFTTISVRTEAGRYGLYEATPADRERAKADAEYINGLIEADEQRRAAEPTVRLSDRDSCPSCGFDVRDHEAGELARCGVSRQAGPPAKPLGLGDPVTYAPRYVTDLPLDGWAVDRLPPEPVYIIKHPNGTAIAAAASEVVRVVPNRRGE